VSLAVLFKISIHPPSPDVKQEEAIEAIVVMPGIKVWLEFGHKFYADFTTAGTLRQIWKETMGYFVDALMRKPSSKFALLYF
jgi:hypothetical protein